MRVKVISQVNKLLELEDVQIITVRTLSGIIQILPNHQNLISALDMSTIKIQLKNGEIKNVLVSGGFVDVKDDEVIVLAEQGDLPQNLVQEEIDKAIERAKNDITSSQLPPSELIILEKMLKFELFKKQHLNL